jgi:hypothetical protein
MFSARRTKILVLKGKFERKRKDGREKGKRKINDG